MDERLLDSVRDGALDLDDWLATAREMLATDEGLDALYDGARDYVLSQIRSDLVSDEDVAALRDGLRRLGALAIGSAPNDEINPLVRLGVRVEALAALTADLAAHQSAYQVEHLRSQPHLEACLRVLELEGGHMSRAAILERLGLKEANGTRVLKLLEKARLIVRRKSGQSVSVSWTALGKKTALAWGTPIATPRREISAWLQMKEGPVNGMSNSNWSMAPEYENMAPAS